jgi:uncharacterized protein YjlB
MATETKGMSDMDTERYEFPETAALPLLVYRRAVKTGSKAADACLGLFARNGWGGGWTDGIHPFHHFHATTHEALGIIRGSARVRFGGKDGPVVAVEAGDAVIIPAGVSHCNEGASDDLLVVGAYPGERGPDLERQGSNEMTPAARKRVQAVPLPPSDPIFGKDGPLLRNWWRPAPT